VLTEVKEIVQVKVEEESQVIVHCHFLTREIDMLIRIWRSTFLIDKITGHKSKLLFAEGISLYPHWTPVPPNRDFVFTCIFSGLPSDCVLFDFAEIIPEQGGFHVPSIPRNKSDVYHIDLN
jgi:hypothetical protein